MNRDTGNSSGANHGGIRLNRLNFTLILIGLVICAVMVVTMYQTTGSVKEIVTVTDNYLVYQQTGGKLQGISKGLAEQAMAFIRGGEPGTAYAYESQMQILEEQLDAYVPEISNSETANEVLLRAINAYYARRDIELHAMRLQADTFPEQKFAALPDVLKEIRLSEEERALSPEEKAAAALASLASEEYSTYGKTIETAVDDSHRISSEQGQIQAAKTSNRVRNIVRQQKILVFLFVLVAAVALLMNRALIISPIQKSVGNLDRREPIPVRGSFEMRHLASVYNEVLKENEQKKEALSYTATHDALTGVYNRAAFDKAYKKLENQQIGIIVADVDRFKQYNDQFGHDVGDRVLSVVAETLKNHFREEDCICRIGGDEFCVIMPGMDHCRGEEIRERMIQINRELAENSGDLPPITLSSGIAFWNRPNPQGSIFKDADSTLLELKKHRTECSAVYKG